MLNKDAKKIIGKIAIGWLLFVLALAPLQSVLAQTMPETRKNIDDLGLVQPNPMNYFGPGTLPTPGPGMPMSDAQVAGLLRGQALRAYTQDMDTWFSQRTQAIKSQWTTKFATAFLGGIIDAMTLVSQRIAYEAAHDLILGNPGHEARFYSDPFGSWKDKVIQDASSKFIDRLDLVVGDWTQSVTSFTDAQGHTVPGYRFSFCKPPDPYTLKLSLSMGEIARMGPGSCTLKKLTDNFNAIGDMVSSGRAVQINRTAMRYGTSDLSVGVEANSGYLSNVLNTEAKSTLERIEPGGGMKSVTDFISGKITYPSTIANESWKSLNPIAMADKNAAETRGAILSNYWWVGFENVWVIGLQTFTNTLIVSMLHKLFDPAPPQGDVMSTPEQTQIVYDALKNEDASGDAESIYQREALAKAIGDFIAPNYTSTEDLDIVSELVQCATPRKRFNCAMDQGLGVTIRAGTKDGGITVGRAAGIGSQNESYSPASQALHTDWEMIPEIDIKNNTDPTCAQRAYCAGNLKKMRLARIIPIGWEMAANSPYNIKKNDKYITLGEVINGFYDCNDQGQIDMNHPWCHLIDPDWIMVAPKYQCRSKGYGDAILPDVGTRLDDCGDVATCLQSKSNGECTGGYGYCLAERPVWRFDAQQCDAQYVSCRTYQSDNGQISILRSTIDRGKCSEDNMGCAWYATQRFATSSATPDGLWVGDYVKGPRVYWDNGVQSCSSEGCTKVYRVVQGQGALNLVFNGSFEQVTQKTVGGQSKVVAVPGWTPPDATAVGALKANKCLTASNFDQVIDTQEGYDGSQSLSMRFVQADAFLDPCFEVGQWVNIAPDRNYTLTFKVKHTKATAKVGVSGDLRFYNNPKYTSQINQLKPAIISAYQDCTFDATNNLVTVSSTATDVWSSVTCQFVAPHDANKLWLSFAGRTLNANLIDSVQLEEGESVTPFKDGLAQGLAEAYLKIAPDEYGCTGDDANDNPACQRFARVCRQTDVGCQGYQDKEDQTAPEIPAILSYEDLCPAICTGYGQYQKLASTFDLVKTPANPATDDPEDDTIAYFIPSLAQQCTLTQVGCDAFTSMEASTSTGETVSYFSDIRYCQKPGPQSATYYTWEGSDTTGYQIKTWSLVASDPNNVESSAPKIFIKGVALGLTKSPADCNANSWRLGTDPDCRQFYDVKGNTYYAFYSQTISSDNNCTNFRKDGSTEADCTKTGGQFQTDNKACMYQVLPAESNTCPASAGGCRAYLGPTGRNSTNVLTETFNTSSTQLTLAPTDKTNPGHITTELSKESVLVGDQSMKISADAGKDIDIYAKVALTSTSSLMRISFWAKSNRPAKPGDLPSKVKVDGNEVGSFQADINWQRFEFGPFYAKSTTAVFDFFVPSNSPNPPVATTLYLDTVKIDQLNDVQFVRKDTWSIPVACDTSREGLPEARAMVGCREYAARNGDTAYVRRFSRLCNQNGIGCQAFIDTNDKPSPFPATQTFTGTAKPSGYAKVGDAAAYEEQFFGDWSVTSTPWRYYYAIDDDRARCDQSEASCRAYGKPVFQQGRTQLATTTYAVDPAYTDIYPNQKTVYSFDTVLMKDDWQNYGDSNGQPKLACRKDELFCNRFQSGSVTEYFRDPGKQTCSWQQSKKLKQNLLLGIPTDGEYQGWFRDGTDIPCYPPYLAGGTNYLIYYSGENSYAGWGGSCPQDQSECTTFIDPNDKSDSTNPTGRPYYLINSDKLDKHTCAGTADPLSGCILFNDTSMGSLEASSQATYAKVMAEKGAAETPIDCGKDAGNAYCTPPANAPTTCQDLKQVSCTGSGCYGSDSSGYVPTAIGNAPDFIKEHDGQNCGKDADCSFAQTSDPNGYEVDGKCLPEARTNDSNVILKVKMDRECARWMGCRTGETVYDSVQQKFVNQCTQLELCQKNGSRNEDIFCSQFTDRSKENFLYPGQFVTPVTYSARKVGFGQLDYSGLVTSFQYILPDLTTENVGADLLAGSKQADQYKQDQHMVAEVPLDNVMASTVPDLLPNQAVQLCRDARTLRYGYVKDGKCIEAISQGHLLIASDQAFGTTESNDIQHIYEALVANSFNNQNNFVQTAMPAPECQLYPEQDSPLNNSYVSEWNTNVTPPVPKKTVTGYESAKACVYGEDCSCSYRKVRYDGGTSQYYSVDGEPPFLGMCQGGDRDGQACTPGGYVPVNTSNQILVNTGSQTQGTDTCPGGTCSAIQDVVFENGRYGYCLERDLTRTTDVSQVVAPCLTWAPQNVLGGKYDLQHRTPTAGYVPPQGSGEYYCTTGANQQKLTTPVTRTGFYNQKVGGIPIKWGNENFLMPGNLQQFAFSRADVWWNMSVSSSYSNTTIDNRSNRYTNSDHGHLDALSATDTPRVDPTDMRSMRFACRRTSVCEGMSALGEDMGNDCQWTNRTAKDSKCPDANDKEGLWIMTGEGPTKSYLEYFIPYTPSGPWYGSMNENYFDYRFGMFKFSLQPYAAGVACKWNPLWMGLDYPTVSASKKEDFSCSNYLQSVQDTSKQFYTAFNSQFTGILDRSSENMLTDSQGIPVKVGCYSQFGTGSSCYYKYWEVGLNNTGQKEFDWINAVYRNNPILFNFNKEFVTDYASECSAGKPYFSIRAMFQNVNSTEDAMASDEARKTKLNGPWQFVGFWVTTCLPNTRFNDPGWLYLRMDMIQANVCREVAQVIAPKTRESAAFADRVWAQGSFILPVLDFTYNTRNEPFGSALASGRIGTDPLLMGISQPTAGDYTKAPTFADSGISLQSLFNYQNSWMPLSNLFARIYKVYRWSPYLVGQNDWACVKGSKFGDWCAPNSNRHNGLVTCGDYATCAAELDPDLINQDWRCNALSGVNRGLHCGDSDVPARNTDPICHNAAMWWKNVNDESVPTPIYADNGKSGSSGCVPQDPNSPDQLTFTLPTKQYEYGNAPIEDQAAAETINFEAFSCNTGEDNPPFLAVPTLSFAKSPSSWPHITKWHEPSALVYGLLMLELEPQGSIDKTTLRYGDYGACVGSAEGYLFKHGEDQLPQPVSQLGMLMADYDGKAGATGPKARLKQYLQDIGLNVSDFDNTPTKNAAFLSYLQKYKTAWELDYSGAPPLIAPNTVPFAYVLGKWSSDKKGILLDYVCSSDAVNAGHSCSAAEDCPKRIDACSGSNKPGDSVKIGSGETAPTCGYCTLGKDQNYTGKDPFATLYPDTGYCFGFNKFARCKTNTDCQFSQFEFWGYRQDENDVEGALGYNYDQSKGILPILYDDKDPDLKNNPINERDPVKVNLPSPLFPNSMQSPPNTTNDPKIQYQVPAKYSEPGALTTLSTDGTCKLVQYSNYICKAITTELDSRLKSSPYGDFHDDWNPESSSGWATNIKNFVDEPSLKSALLAAFDPLNLVGIFDCSGAGCTERAAGRDIFMSLTEDALNCSLTCSASAVYVPNGYAAHFTEIKDNSKYVAGTSQEYRTATLAPFIVNPLWRYMRSIGYHSSRTTGYCETPNGGWYGPDHDNTDDKYCDDNSVQSSQVVTYFIEGRYWEWAWRMLYRPAHQANDERDQWNMLNSYLVGSWGSAPGTGCSNGTNSDCDPYTRMRFNEAVPDSVFKPVAALAGTFLDNYAKYLGWTDFNNRLNGLDQSSIENDVMPWDGSLIFYGKLFPLLFDDNANMTISDVPEIWHNVLGASSYATWVQSMAIFTGYGFSSDLAQALKDMNTSLNTEDLATYNLAKAKQDLANLQSTDPTKIQSANDAITNAQKVLNEDDLDLADKKAAFQKKYKEDMQINFFNKTGWGSYINEDDPSLQLFPGALPAARPVADKNLPSLFIPGHCEPPKNGTDKDSYQDGKFVGVDLSPGTSDKIFPAPEAAPGGKSDFGIVPAHDSMAQFSSGRIMNHPQVLGKWNADYDPGPTGDQGWFQQKIDMRRYFVSAWDDQSGGYNTNYTGTTQGNGWKTLTDNAKSDANDTPSGATLETYPGYSDYTNTQLSNDQKWTASKFVAGTYVGDDVQMPAPVGAVSDLRTTCRCQGGKYDGMPKSNQAECNIDLPADENPDNYNPNARYDVDPSDYCRPVTGSDGKPANYCQGETGNPGDADPDKDDNICTHNPGYIPRGDVCADGRDDCLTAYNLNDPYSTGAVHGEQNNPYMSSDPILSTTVRKDAPSATDVTIGLDSYKFMTGWSDPKNVRINKDDKSFTAVYQPIPPRVGAPDLTQTSGAANTLKVQALDAISVDGLPQGLVYYGGGQGLATLRFFAWAAHNQGPLKRIIIDWGDGNVDKIDAAQMKNQKPVCNSSSECANVPGLACNSDTDCPPKAGACLPTGTCRKSYYKTGQTCHSDSDCGSGDTCDMRMMFGNTQDQCRQGYFEFKHAYRCANEGDVPTVACYDNVGSDKRCAQEPNLTCNACRSDESCVGGEAPPKGCYNQQLNRCRFTPRVMVFDNWGWCTGNCSMGTDKEGKDNYDLIRHPNLGCYDGSQTKVNSEVTYPYTSASEVLSDRGTFRYTDDVKNERAYQECEVDSYISVDTSVHPADYGRYYSRRPWVVFGGSVEVEAMSPFKGIIPPSVVPLNCLDGCGQAKALCLQDAGGFPLKIAACGAAEYNCKVACEAPCLAACDHGFSTCMSLGGDPTAQLAMCTSNKDSCDAACDAANSGSGSSGQTLQLGTGTVILSPLNLKKIISLP